MAVRILLWTIIVRLVLSAVSLALRVAWGSLTLILVGLVVYAAYRKGWLGGFRKR